MTMVIMRRRLIAVIVLLIAMSLASIFTINPRFPSAIALQTRPYILIVGNSGFTSANGVTSGTGTASDPYVIQGWNITVCWHCPYYGIEVANTTAYFRIFNVTVSSLITAQPATGILLKNATNGGIDNSVVQDQSIFCCGGAIFLSCREIIFKSDQSGGGRW